MRALSVGSSASRANTQIIAVPIRKAQDLATVAPVLQLVRNVGSKALDQVNLDVFWLHRGRLHPLRAQMKDGQLEQLSPPDEFTRLVEHLPRDQVDAVQGAAR
ncbi:hypothetical protein AB0425_12910 [Actinosynnema sp. NPDC051121]